MRARAVAGRSSVRSRPAEGGEPCCCRECGRPLATAAEKKRGRCADCPASYDEELFEQLRAAGLPLDTLSMGMTADLEAAIHAGSTMVRVGTAIFGGRTYPA